MEYYDGIIKMAKIDLEFPYTEKYKAGYVRVNSCEKCEFF
jgi:hypothetical protein